LVDSRIILRYLFADNQKCVSRDSYRDLPKLTLVVELVPSAAFVPKSEHAFAGA